MVAVLLSWSLSLVSFVHGQDFPLPCSLKFIYAELCLCCIYIFMRYRITKTLQSTAFTLALGEIVPHKMLKLTFLFAQ